MIYFDKFKRVVELVNKDILEIKGRPENAIKALESFYNTPILSGKSLQQITELTQPTVDGVIRGMIEKDILREITGYSRNRIYSLHKYLKIFAYEEENSENLF
jgi:hypothetical protein